MVGSLHRAAPMRETDVLLLVWVCACAASQALYDAWFNAAVENDGVGIVQKVRAACSFTDRRLY